MKNSKIITDFCPEEIKPSFLYWRNYLKENITFNLTESEIHTRQHAERVLLYALLIGRQILGNTPDDLTALAHAAIFHDTRRMDDWLDVGHGARSAAYYSKYCETKSDIMFLEPTYLIMKYHDRDDRDGMEAIRQVCAGQAEHVIRLYQIFKDADALDRFRLGATALDVRFLRNEAALQLVDLAREAVRQTI